MGNSRDGKPESYFLRGEEEQDKQRGLNCKAVPLLPTSYFLTTIRGYGLHLAFQVSSRSAWDGTPKGVKVAYAKGTRSEQDPKYRGARGIPWEVGGTTLQA